MKLRLLKFAYRNFQKTWNANTYQQFKDASAFKRHCLITLDHVVDNPSFNPKSFGKTNHYRTLLQAYGLPSNLNADTIDPSALLTVIAECKLIHGPGYRSITHLVLQVKRARNRLYGHIPTLQAQASMQLNFFNDSMPFSDILGMFDQLSRQLAALH